MAAAASAVSLFETMVSVFIDGTEFRRKVTVITDEVEAEGNEFRFKRTFEYMIRYVCPTCLASILIFGTLDMFGIFSLY